MENGFSNIGTNLNLQSKQIKNEIKPTSDGTKTGKSSNTSLTPSIEDTVNLSKESILASAKDNVATEVNEFGTKITKVFDLEVDGVNIQAESDGISFSKPFDRESVDFFDLKGNDSFIRSRGGNDFAIVEGDRNQINVGEGDDTIVLAGERNQVQLGAGTDTLLLKGDRNRILDSGQQSSTKITINGDENRLRGSQGTDTINLAGKESLIQSQQGNDTINLVGDDNIISTSLGQDTITSTGDGNRIFSGQDDDTISVEGDENLIIAGSGNDTINVSGKNNDVFAGSGDDVINIGDNNTITNEAVQTLNHEIDFEAPEFTQIVLGSGDDTVNLTKTEGDFIIEGVSGNNTLNLSFNSQDVKGELAGNTLIITAGENFKAEVRNISTINFADGSSLTAQEVADLSSNESAELESEEPNQENILKSADATIQKALDHLLTINNRGNALDLVG